jgi:iron complex outermembrane receptor protein
LNGDWDFNEAVNFKVGGVFRQFDFHLVEAARDSTYCAAFTCAPGAYGAPVTAALTSTFNLRGDGQPAGTTTRWVAPNLKAAAKFVDLYNRPLLVQATNNRSVTEKDKDGYAEVNIKSQALGLDYALNAGLRYVRTEQSSKGINSNQTVTVDRHYDDWLPPPTPRSPIAAASSTAPAPPATSSRATRCVKAWRSRSRAST